MEETRRQLRAGGSLCGFPIRPDDPRFGVVDWTLVAPEESLILFKSMLAWFLAGSNLLSPNSSMDRQRSEPELLGSESVEDFWRRYGHNIPDLIESGDLQIETAALQVDPGGVPIQVYRVTVIDPDTDPKSGTWHVRTCSPSDHHAPRPVADLFFPLRPNRWEEFKRMNALFFAGRKDVVLWNGHPYVGTADRAGIGLHGLSALSDGTLYYQQSVCEIRIRGE
jgi:hypothetical protein